MGSSGPEVDWEWAGSEMQGINNAGRLQPVIFFQIKIQSSFSQYLNRFEGKNESIS